MDNHEITHLILLDLSGAFDMVDHEILIKHLNNRFGIRDTALQWIESYLENRSQKITIGDLGTDLGMTSKAVTLTLKKVVFWNPFCLHYTRNLWDEPAGNMELPTIFMPMTNRFISYSNL